MQIMCNKKRLTVFENYKPLIFMSGWQDLNLRPPAPKAGAIPGYATPRTSFGVSNEVAKVYKAFNLARIIACENVFFDLVEI